MATITIDDDVQSLLDGFDELYDNTSLGYDDCCEGGDVCDLSVGVNFEAAYIPVLYCVVFVVGMVGNGVLLVVLFRSRKAWSVTDTFILHLGVADILLLLTLPFWAAQAVHREGWQFGTPVCKMTGAVFTINFYCGIFLLACISLDRYLSIVHATQMYSRRKPWAIHASCMAVWAFSLFLSIPDWIFYEALFDGRRMKNECIPNYSRYNADSLNDWQLASRLVTHIIGFLIPSAVLLFCYSCILRRLRCGSQGLQKQKAFRVIIAVVVVFFLCWTPYNVTLIVDTVYSNADDENNTCAVRLFLEKAVVVTASVGYLHCSLNPILYAFVGVKFRRQLLEILRSLGCKTCIKLQSAVNSRRSSIWSESADTSNSIAI
ncbi:C-X-C chemokine receptor type 3.1 [Parambassis ranga]|uniref:C-X-C chemokine receptor type 3 n=1 Tax=Parambassis ranga TaxID=210632 RepID=A0A6P7JVA5_9TELE|nr:C-X-C chemokine receptor type 3-like [Parambassis ranga]XP_028280925.1 C-X-C chemokine receptor type 3-like [Parambassis ranga]